MFDQAFNNIDYLLRKDNGCTSELDYAAESPRLLILKYIDILGYAESMNEWITDSEAATTSHISVITAHDEWHHD